MGIIELNDMVFFANHGCFEEEKVIGNKFVVDFRAEMDLSIPAVSDNINDTANYQTMYEIIAKEMEIPSNLLENIAGRILSSIKSSFPAILSCSVTVRKLSPPLGGQVGSSSVTMGY